MFGEYVCDYYHTGPEHASRDKDQSIHKDCHKLRGGGDTSDTLYRVVSLYRDTSEICIDFDVSIMLCVTMCG